MNTNNKTSNAIKEVALRIRDLREILEITETFGQFFKGIGDCKLLAMMCFMKASYIR